MLQQRRLQKDKEGIENLPEVITFPAFPSIQALEKPAAEEDTRYIGSIAENCLRKFASKSVADITYGLYDMDGNTLISATNQLLSLIIIS